MRPLCALFLLLTAAQAQELLQAKGKTLDEFDVVVDLSRVDHSSARGLAEAYARMHVQNHAMSRHFTGLYHREHEAIVTRYFTDRVVQHQKMKYARAEKRGQKLECVVSSVEPKGDDRATALLRSTLKGMLMGKSVTMHLELKRVAGKWWLDKVLTADPKHGFQDRGIGLPAAVPAIVVPEPSSADLSTAKAAVMSMRRDVVRFGAVSAKAKTEMYREIFTIVAEFFGQGVADAEHKKLKTPEPSLPRVYQMLQPDAPVDGTVRIQILVKEEIPGGDGKRSAIGNFAFDLRKDVRLNEWRIVGETWRPKPDQPMVPRTDSFGLLFIG